MSANKPHQKVQRTSNKKYTLKKAITHIKVDPSNPNKLEKLDRLAEEYMRVAQLFCDDLIANDARTPDKNANLLDVQTELSARWQRTAWRQACGIVQSWFSNERTHPPVLTNISIQANPNVAELQQSTTGTFDYWIKLATLDKGCPVYLPVKLYRKAAETIQKYPCLFNGVTLNRLHGEWYLTLVVGKENLKGAYGEVIGIDIGMRSMLVTSEPHQYGQISGQVRQRVERSRQKFAGKQKLNACLVKKGLAPVSLFDGRTERFVRNQAGRAINQMLAELPEGTAIAMERLSVKDMRFKSRAMNRWMKASQLGYVADRIQNKLDFAGIRYRSVQAAYSSQQCSECGFVDKNNRRDQEHFVCLHCGFTANADENAARNIAKRFGDDELNRCSFPKVKELLESRFQANNLPVARSATAGREPIADYGQSVQFNAVYIWQ